MAFLDQNYLLSTAAGRSLYQAIADLPIVDPHNHADVREIWENRNYTDIWQVEGATDHYLWELLRKRGVPESHITGDASAHDKWLAMAGVFEQLVGNPTYEWIHLDLKRRLGIDELINADTAEIIWQQSKEVLAQPEMRPRQLLNSMKVKHLCSTDDPTDNLQFHRQLAEEECGFTVHPTFRPDRAVNIFKADWTDYIHRLEKRFGTTIKNVRDLINALQTAHDYFAEYGCVASDHGVEVPYAYDVDEDVANGAFRKAMQGKELDEDDIIGFMSFMMNECAAMDAEKDWVFQIHMGCVRDVRAFLWHTLGPDSGGDVSDHTIDIVAPLSPLLNRFDGRLKVVLYTLDPHHQATVATLCRAFGEHVNPGSAWWFNDTPIGMRRQLEYLGSVDLLMNFAGMVSDSRKLLSFGSRNEMFRRVLCDVVGEMTERGQMPLPLAERLVAHLAYDRPRELFGL